MTACTHAHLQLAPSPFAKVAGYVRPIANKRLAANKASGRISNKDTQTSADDDAEATTFPAPLVLPWDDLNLDPEWPPQTFRSWLNERERNKPTKERNAIYFASVPDIDSDVSYMREWTRPCFHANEGQTGGQPPRKRSKLSGIDNLDERTELHDLKSPDHNEFIAYLSAFFSGFRIEKYPKELRYVPWKKGVRVRNKGTKGTLASEGVSGLPRYIGLESDSTCTRIRVRKSRDDIFPAQLNLNDILDHLIATLPSDAYSVILLVNHDIHEDDEDDFCCGRAYGGSRIAVVQSARYNPLLDSGEKIDYAHMWPTSHCATYIDQICAKEEVYSATKSSNSEAVNNGAIRAAITAASKIAYPSSMVEFRALWFSRLARTVVHELGHCLGMDHCVYYACNMQGTASMNEDARQPPYLCPVCLSKVSHAVVRDLQGGGEEQRLAYVKDRYSKLLDFCKQRSNNSMFVGYAAWLEVRIAELAHVA